jgi:predicted acyltransferase
VAGGRDESSHGIPRCPISRQQGAGTLFAPLAAPKNASLLFAASHLLVLFLVLYVLYGKRIFLKA